MAKILDGDGIGVADSAEKMEPLANLVAAETREQFPVAGGFPLGGEFLVAGDTVVDQREGLLQLGNGHLPGSAAVVHNELFQDILGSGGGREGWPRVIFPLEAVVDGFLSQLDGGRGEFGPGAQLGLG